jgi:tetratricopeptide (TPR) repeat protein
LRIVLIAFLVIISLASEGSPESLDLLRKRSIALAKTNLDSAELLANQLLIQAKNEDYHYGVVQSNFILGWIYHTKLKNYGRAIIYYLEGIRYGERNNYDGVEQTLVSLNKNIGNICSKFRNHDASLKFYQEALKYSELTEDNLQAIKILIKISISYRHNDEHALALEFLNKAKALNNIQGNKQQELDIINEIGNCHIDNGLYEEAIGTFEQNLRLYKIDDYKKFPTHKSYALGNIAESYLKLKNYENSELFYLKSIAFKDSINLIASDPWSYYLSLKGYADALFGQQKYYEALDQLLIAEEHVLSQKDHQIEYLTVFNSMAGIYEILGDYEKANEYNKKHSFHLNELLKEQQQIEQVDKNYNLDLITQRYYSLVAQQEKNERIELYGALTAIAFILTVVLFVLISNYREKTFKRQLEKAIRILNIP